MDGKRFTEKIPYIPKKSSIFAKDIVYLEIL
jgi:hypothetical protein